MNIAIYTNYYKDKDGSITKTLVDKLHALGMNTCQINDSCSHEVINKDIDVNKIDCLIVLGGDGTLLSACKLLKNYKVPMLGINIGNLGFLSSFEYDKIDEAVSSLQNWNFNIDERTLIQTEFQGKTCYALNDIVVSRMTKNSVLGHVVKFNLYSNDVKINNVMSDGVIVATSTGSTAYSLSAGGPIMDPTVDAIILTTICSHSLNSRPICLNGSAKVKVEVGNSFAPCTIEIDGYIVGELNMGENIIIEKSPLTITLLKSKEENFYTKLNSKLSTWSS